MSNTDEVLFARIPGTEGDLGEITLNRPKAFNALTIPMCLAVDQQLQQWANDDSIKAVVLRSQHEKAFCAGGDIRYLYDTGKTDPDKAAEFTWTEYRMNHRIHHFNKPYIAFMDGITMGGGVGISVHGSHRVVSEFTTFSMPETGIGFFPDVGGSYFLPRCPGEIGLYLGLSGARLKAADTCYAGIADHFIRRDAIDETIEQLANTCFVGDANTVVTDILQQHATQTDTAPLAAQRSLIDQHFAADTLPVIMDSLQQSTDAWCQATFTVINSKSPTSLQVTFKQLRRDSDLSFDACMQMEYRISRQFFRTADFYEGVRAVVVDKDQSPNWSPATLDAISNQDIMAFFDPIEHELYFTN